MCGFSGIIDLDGKGFNSDIDKKMSESLLRLYPRGPDQQNLWKDEFAYLVHTRLSILDVSKAGMQPMVKYNKALVYNGEIYNFKELRSQLIKVGYNFTSNSDCEVLIAGWDYWGELFLNKIDGMFAFALWDFKSKKLILARDPFGKKPLLYSIENNQLFFSSELKSLEKIINKAEINTLAVESLFKFRFIHEPLTIYKQVKKLSAGHILVYADDSIKINKWYNVSLINDFKSDKTLIKKDLITLFDSAVEKRLVSDVPLGVLLSGGIDSSLIVASLAEKGKSLPCYTMGFENSSTYYEERPEALKLANHFGMKHYSLEVSSSKLLSIIPEVFQASDEPFADSSALPFYALSKEISNNLTVALSGDGGDEVFGGYRKYIGEKWWFLSKKIPSYLRNLLISVLIENKNTKLGEFSRKLRRFLINSSKDNITRHIGWLEQLTDEEILSLLGYSLNTYRELFLESRNNIDDNINAMLMGDLNISLVGDMLVKIDRMSMANSLEIRSPFLDKKLVEYAFSIPGNMKVGNLKGKKILRETFTDRLPHWCLNIPKKGFEVPIQNWLQTEIKPM